MPLLSLADSCRLLAIDARTLHRWLRLAHISVQAHPIDARFTCLTSDQVQHLAAMHRRTLPESSEPPFPVACSASSIPSDGNTASVCSCVRSAASGPITELTRQPGSLHAQIAALQHHLTLLTEQVKHEQPRHTSILKTIENHPLDTSATSSPDTSTTSSPQKEAIPASIDRRQHPHVLPLVEYGVQGNSVVISPQEGLLSFEPDSPEWFAWLSTLPSFRFIGQHGRLTAFHGSQCSATTPWWGHRQIRHHSHKRRLGFTAQMTIAA